MNKVNLAIFPIIVIGILIMCAIMCQFSVETGEKAVVLRFGSLNRIADEGLNFKAPFVDNVKTVSIRDRNLTMNSEVSSSDIQTIAVEVSLVYSLDPNSVGKIYQTYGTNIEQTLIRPTLSEKINAVIAEYPIEAFVEKRAEISARINNHSLIKLKVAVLWLKVCL